MNIRYVSNVIKHQISWCRKQKNN